MKRCLLAVFLCLLSVHGVAGLDDGARYAFLSSHSQKSVIVIDLVEREIAREIPLADSPDGVTASDSLRAAIVSHRRDNKLTLIDLASADLDRYDYPLDIRPDLVQVSPIGETVAILDRERGTLQVHALRRREVLVSVDEVNTLSDITFGPDGSTIYWVDEDAGVLHSVDLWSTHRQLQLAGGGLSAMSRSIDGRLGFISSAGDGNVHVVDLRTFAVIRSSRAGRGPGRPWGTADGRYMLVPNMGSATVTALSAATGDSLYTTRAAADPVSVNPGWLDTVAAVIGGEGNIVFLSVSDGAELARVAIEGSPDEGVVTSDSRTLVVPLPGAGSVAFYDMREQVLLETIAGMPNDIGAASLAISNNLCH